MTKRFGAVIALLVLVSALAGAGAADAASARTSTKVVRIAATDFKFRLTPRTVPAGRITFEIRNDGQAMHDFAIHGHTSKTISPGGSTRLTLTLRRGSYPYRCTVDDHARLGMKGVLRVT